jgi:Chalcone isomerase-like
MEQLWRHAFEGHFKMKGFTRGVGDCNVEVKFQMKTRIQNRVQWVVLGFFLANACAYAAPFEPTQVVAGTPLVLNGSGTRYRTIFKVYDMGVYLKSKASTAEAIVDMAGPKKLSFVALREIPGTDLGTAFLRGIEGNSTKENILKHTVSSLRLIEIFSGKNKLLPGDTFAMEYTPGKGTVFTIGGVAQGAAVGDAEFFSMILRIWLGHSPADWKLKEALLASDAR